MLFLELWAFSCLLLKLEDAYADTVADTHIKHKKSSPHLLSSTKGAKVLYECASD